MKFCEIRSRAGAAQNDLRSLTHELLNPAIAPCDFFFGKKLRQVAVLEIRNPPRPATRTEHPAQWKLDAEVVAIVVGERVEELDASLSNRAGKLGMRRAAAVEQRSAVRCDLDDLLA